MSKKAAKKSKSSSPNRSDFIRSLPATLNAKDVVAKGKQAGLSFSSNLVYAVRHALGQKASKAPSRATPKKRGPKPKAHHAAPSTPSGTAKTAHAAKGATQSALTAHAASNGGHRVRVESASHGQNGRDQEKQFLGLVIEMGFARAGTLIRDLRHRTAGVTA